MILTLVASAALMAEHCKPNYMRLYDQATRQIITTTYDQNATKCEYLKATADGYDPKGDKQLQRDLHEMRRQARLIKGHRHARKHRQ